MIKLLFLISVCSELFCFCEANVIQSKKQQAIKENQVNNGKITPEFSAKEKKPNTFSYTTPSYMKNNPNIKEFSYKDHQELNNLKHKLILEKGTNVEFSYAEALQNYLKTQNSIPMVNIKASVAEILSGIDFVKTSFNQAENVIAPTVGASNLNMIGQTSDITLNKTTDIVMSTAKNNVTETQIVNTVKPILVTVTITPVLVNATTTEQTETESPELEENQTNSPSRCFCMESCSASTTFQGHCGKPNSLGVRKTKCCSSGGPTSSAEEPEENEY